ncbi:hypothetical protein FP435_03670 [Lactobacillus sp. PV037]|uniref:hypothetical protein n=1 Tax=unclassified Lactobacillus TaxID=2620435 RepID=UPI0022400FA6|nr:MULTISPECIES: hypothetical protein [unclassified Lactobacillus]QNQ82284.1 hypothetical protein FP433_04160 [Lactobacillus sp. PV012]QNQ83605.1 hypothetical protein FP435_03670 [Lactobacillus sp. PV037]
MKKHFIFLGVEGVTYYSWLLSLIFVAVIFGYEANKGVSIPCLSLSIIFVLLVIYTWLTSYYKEDQTNYILKLPYAAAMTINSPKLRMKWKFFKIYELKGKSHSYLVLSISK